MKSGSIVAVITATLLVSSTHALDKATPARTDQADESVKTVKELQKERIAVLEAMTEQLDKLYRDARVEYDEVAEAKQLLIQAKLDAAETDAERVELYKQLVDVLKAGEAYVEVRRQAELETQPHVLKAKAKRLEAEIHLEQLRVKIADSAR